MKLSHTLAPAVLFRLASAYLVSPPGTAAPGASDRCSAWVKASYGLSCEIIGRFWGMSQAEFEEWASLLLHSYRSFRILTRVES